jgi:hypothetical protein
MFFGDHLKLIGWWFFATASTKVGYNSVLRLQLDYLGRPQTLLAELLMHVNALVATVWLIVWLHRILVDRK